MTADIENFKYIDKDYAIKSITMGVIYEMLILSIVIFIVSVEYVFLGTTSMIEDIDDISIFIIILDYISTCIVSPISEEWFFRKLIFKSMRNKFSFRKSALISSIIFGIFHLNPFTVVGAIFVGYLACIIYEKTRELKYSILFHMAANTFSMLFDDLIMHYVILAIFKFKIIILISISLIFILCLRSLLNKIKSFS